MKSLVENIKEYVDNQNHVDYINDLILKNRYYGPVQSNIIKKLNTLKKPQDDQLTSPEIDWLTIGADLRWKDIKDKDIIEITPQEAWDLLYSPSGRRKENREYILITQKDGELAGRACGGEWIVSETLCKSDPSKFKKILRDNPNNLKFYHIPNFKQWATDCLLDSINI